MNLYKDYINYKNFLRNNKFFFFNNNFQTRKNNSEILVEFNRFQNSHISLSYLSNILSKFYNSKINAYYNYSLIAAPLKNTFLNNIKWQIGNFFSLKSFGVYRSFGVNKIFRPQITLELENKLKKYFNKIYLNLKNKNDVLNIKFDKILVGDLIYDTYLKYHYKPTLDIKDEKFKNLLKDFLLLYFFWQNYFRFNNVKSVIAVHTPYSFGLILRIAIHKKIPAYVTSSRFIYYLNKEMPYMHGHFKKFKKIFSKLKKKEKLNAYKLAKKRLDLRFKGVNGAKVDLISNEISSFSSKKKKNLILRNKKIKLLIAPHDFFDAVHIYGDILFTDFYEWLIFLGELSNKTDYDWYMKNRPNFSGKFQKYQPFTNAIIAKICKKYPKIKLLPNDYSHHQIINEKIDFVLTCYGSVGVEYPYFNIPVINASINNPHINYNFNIHPKSKKNYEQIIKNLKKIKNKKIKYSKKAIYEYYFMRNIYTDKNWLIDNLSEMVKFVGGYDGMWSSKFYEFWNKSLNTKKHQRVIKSIENFLKSKEHFMNLKHTDRFNKILNS